jgi:hypothetical protein
MSNRRDKEQVYRDEHRAAIKAAVAFANSIVKPAAAEHRSPRTDFGKPDEETARELAIEQYQIRS